jgi:hypothetical protein
MLEKKYKDFLDNLRKSGITNMYGARPYIESMFEIDKKEATRVLTQWMKEFKK